MKILVINGPNINLLGLREPEVYGTRTYEELVKMISDEARIMGVEIEFFQSNHEGEIVDAIQGAHNNADAVILNPAAYTHTSIAVLDAIKAVGIPTAEVHISDPDTREEFRRISYIRSACVTTIKGHDLEGYVEALHFLFEYLST